MRMNPLAYGVNYRQKEVIHKVYREQPVSKRHVCYTTLQNCKHASVERTQGIGLLFYHDVQVSWTFINFVSHDHIDSLTCITPLLTHYLFLSVLLPQSDPSLDGHRLALVTTAARSLDKARMIRYVERTGSLHSTDLGRTASHYYIKFASIEVHVADANISSSVYLAVLSEFWYWLADFNLTLVYFCYWQNR